ncbi:unnamed protein product [Heligmosomoides polygyrus]|uniref:WH1 domain-containing protein n=1 Tax=Heligmosomoides polygyrus TaxID=6339 RepID=A0A3P7Y8K2_HELPZ|nr:unnamed protein product [Heligmosomoides polygyrus]
MDSKSLMTFSHLPVTIAVFRCGEPTCFHEWFRNRDHNSNPVRDHIQLFDHVYPTVRNTIAVNLAGAADQRKLQRAYRVYSHEILAKISSGEPDTESEIATIKWWMKNSVALTAKPFPGMKEFDTVYVSYCLVRDDDKGFFFITRYKGASSIVRFFFYEGDNNEQQWHATMTAFNVIVGEEHIRKMIQAASARRMSLCEFIENILWPFADRLSAVQKSA